MEYERIAYQSIDQNEIALALIKKGDCCIANENFDDAEFTLSRIKFNDLPDSIFFNAHYKNAFACYLNGNYSAADGHLLQIQNLLEDSVYIIKSLLLHAMVLNELDKFADAKQKLLLYVNSIKVENKGQLLNEIELAYQEKNIPKYKDPEKANKLSTFLPGVGQLYAGYFWEGAASVAFQLVGLSFGVYSFFIKNYITSVLIGLSFFQKFYLGGVKRAEFLVNKRNYIVKRKFNDRTKKMILSYY